MDFGALAATDRKRSQWNVVIETPKGSANKFKFDPELKTFRLNDVLPEGMAFPFDYGYLPSTLGDDGDPVDVLLIMDQPTFCGCVVPARLVGVIEALQTELDGTINRNDRLVAIPLKTRRYAQVRNLHDLNEQMIGEVGDFFSRYNAGLGKKFKVLRLRGPRHALKLAEKGMKKYRPSPRAHRRPRA